MSAALLDTHTLMWLINDSPQLSVAALKHIQTPGIELLFSYASVWEIAIKSGIGKLHLPQAPEPYLMKHLALNKVRLLPISLHAIFKSGTLPLHHRDPFDRLLIAQCLHAKLTIVSGDEKLDAYGVTRIW